MEIESTARALVAIGSNTPGNIKHHGQWSPSRTTHGATSATIDTGTPLETANVDLISEAPRPEVSVQHLQNNFTAVQPERATLISNRNGENVRVDGMKRD